MSTTEDLMGYGLSPALARELGNSPATLTCAGTTQADAATVTSALTQLSAAGGATGAVLNPRAPVGKPYFFSNPNATSALIYAPNSVAPVGATTLNGAASTTPYTLAQNKSLVMIQMAMGKWVTIPSP